MKPLMLLTLTALLLCCCTESNSQNEALQQKDGVQKACEGCEALYECPVPFAALDHIDTLPGFEGGNPQLRVEGTVYRADGTPAPNVILYVYHTDRQGIYPKRGDEKGWAERHGYIRGWMRTNEKGEYAFYTLRPGAYPGGGNPEHIHILVKEEGKPVYFIDDYHFADDPILQASNFREAARGGSGIIRPQAGVGILQARRDIFLGRNMPGY